MDARLIAVKNPFMQDDSEMKGRPIQRSLKRSDALALPIQLLLTEGAMTKSKALMGRDTARAQIRHLKNTEIYRPPRLFPSSSATSLDDDSDTPAVASVRAGEYTDITS